MSDKSAKAVAAECLATIEAARQALNPPAAPSREQRAREMYDDMPDVVKDIFKFYDQPEKGK